MKSILISFSIILLLSCSGIEMKSYSSSKYSSNDQKEIDVPLSNNSYVITYELLNSGRLSNDETVVIHKDDVISKCENQYFNVLDFFKNGDFSTSRVIFDIMLENLEYLYPEGRLSDSLMLSEFSASSQRLSGSGRDIIQIYKTLYADNNDESILKVETYDAEKKSDIDVFKNYIVDKTKFIFKNDLQPDDEFYNKIIRSYKSYAENPDNVRETYLRFSKYKNFLEKIMEEESVPQYTVYLPAVLTYFYNNSNSGGIWKLERSGFSAIREDVGASTAEVIKRFKSRKSDHINTVSVILEKRGTQFEEDDTSNLNSDEMAEFVAISILMSDPEKLNVEIPESEDSSAEWYANYTKYKSNPENFAKSVKKTSKRSTRSDSYVKIRYNVRKGDNLEKIATLFQTDVESIKKWNPISTSKKYLTAGTVLYLRGYNFNVYTARNGDYLSGICKKFGMKQSTFKLINNMSSEKIYRNHRYIVYNN
ncbi:MAG: LysM peptidoglycan-binding domain-containing protein [Candidatus Delongbacteria bacterium]|nr:LysM peptidoglycan-binding domain-containing protein [Candidatus Delongbacteria bacterium]MBN2835661.1 LysM peptidoglycan-binding domain-containing protein [Candidatus Delongbacteria bacterium]